MYENSKISQESDIRVPKKSRRSKISRFWTWFWAKFFRIFPEKKKKKFTNKILYIPYFVKLVCKIKRATIPKFWEIPDDLESRDIFENPTFSGTCTPLYVTHPITGNTGFVKKNLYSKKKRKRIVYIFVRFLNIWEKKIFCTTIL